MAFENFQHLMSKVQSFSERKKVAVAAAEDEHSLEAVLEARKNNIIEPILIGNSEKILAYLRHLGASIPNESIIHADTPEDSAKMAVEFVRKKQADFIMKGIIDTAVLMRRVVDRESGLRSNSIMSHLAILEIPGYHKLLGITDGGMILHPNLEEKKAIIENAVNFLNAMGYTSPKVAILAAVEKVNPKMPETVNAAELKKMNLEGKIKNCIIEGPISYDLAMSKESAAIKGYESPVTGDVDLMVVPSIAAGNILAKGLIYSAGAKMAGVIVGARVPIVLTSRGATTEEKLLSLMLSAAAV